MAEDKRGSKYLLLTSLGALGVVFGDIGTSPLYAFRESFHAAEGLAVTEASVLGILSLMFWSLLLVVSIKYLVYVMRADNHGEGGILALTALAGDGISNQKKNRRSTLLLIGLFGTALLYGDGVITPAISVLSAVEGLGVIAPNLESYVVPVAGVIIVALFLIQRAGTARVGSLFGPVMIVWFGTLALLGLIQVIEHPRVLIAVSPTYAVSFILDNPRLAFLALGSVFLVVTGAEALYADMGHFGRRPIRLAWAVLVMPALLANYFGQGALLISDPSAITNPFYSLAPGWARFPLVILATMAAVIASQALISGAFSLTQQAILLGYLPRMNVDHTSPREIGQVYLGAVNYMLMVTCLVVVFAFGSSTNLAAAYGVAVTTTMVITSLLLYVVMRYRWGWSALTAGSLTALFLAIDLAFFSANIIKVPEGGWFPLAIGLAILVVMITWKTGRARLTKRIRSGELSIERFIGSISHHPQRRVPGTAVYMFSDLGATPPPLLKNLRHNEVLHDTVLIVTVEWTHLPRVHRAKRPTVHELGEGFYQVLLRYGFIETPDVPGALANITTAEFGFDPDDAVYFVGKETIIPTEKRSIWSLRDRFFALMHRNAASPVRFFGLPSERVIEVGTQVAM
ncbi:MAG TPA: potassium transporter Kup [Acidimicrobiia bacterium]|nr:potassium transporter Kup [Acidimicrobiia bacterium]